MHINKIIKLVRWETILNHKGTKEMETDRLVLRKFRETDASNMYNNWASDSEVTKYLSWDAHSSVESTKQLLNMWVSEYNDLEHYQWAIELKENGELIGNISLIEIDNYNETCEAGYCISKSIWNKGIVTEALLKIIEFAFNEIKFERIGAHYDIANVASGRVMEKCNFKYEGTLRKIYKNNYGDSIDCKYYSILKDELVK
jgi:[ribosomal protein S5]-alanine N-acetyltransferase